MNQRKYQLIATCAAGVEGLVGDELRQLGYDVQVENGRVRFEGTQKDIAKTNLWLRIADRVKIIIGEFQAYTFDELFEKTKSLPWEEYIPMNGAFPVAGKSIQSKLHSVPDVQRLVNKAIAERIKQIYHRRGMLPETGAKYPIEVALRKDHVLITLDTTGDGLFKRGYRTEKGGAPLKENLAAALVKLTTWTPDRPFVDPTCGSGTIAIEAAMIGLNIAPGFNRDFLCESWELMDPNVWEEVRAEAEELADYDQELDILAFDIDGRMIAIAKANAEAAGLGYAIEFKQMQVADFKTDKSFGIIVSNPPYGERLSDSEAVHKLYRQMGEVFAPLKNWSKYILTSDLEFEKYYGNKATKKRKLYNGPLRTDYFQYWGKRY
ncbi:THUMP domain-containing class I SAM-dependent RNA methyltransferase [Allofustis seminis]|uniref:THUMP domain-containing class I SAM-dependent RNA methyltransferase n=1 Tax=Allofustis seminis TaxID=166939 RepID=UPI00036A1316|nr:class I SAM-dependent RNA methyltransferase [Allofustis seminis]